MRLLSIQQPWAELILRGLKDVENRKWRTNHQGPLLIHASRTVDKAEVERHGLPDDIRRGAIVGIVNVLRCTKQRTSPCHKVGQWGWYLDQPRRFRTPVPFSAGVGLRQVADRLVVRAARSAVADRPAALPPPASPLPVDKRLTIFSWGYDGWGNATRKMISAVDLAEARRGFAPPVFVDVRRSRSVRAVGFRERAFDRLLGHARYRWMRSLGNPNIGATRRRKRRVECPDAAHQLLDLALDASRERRRLIFFCSCKWPKNGDSTCHRTEVAKHLRRVARARGFRIKVQEWPGGEPWSSPVLLRMTKRALDAVRRGRQSVVLPRSIPLQSVGGLPWGTIVELKAGNERQLASVGPARFERRRWVLPLFLQAPVRPEDRYRALLRNATRQRRGRGVGS